MFICFFIFFIKLPGGNQALALSGSHKISNLNLHFKTHIYTYTDTSKKHHLSGKSV